jgi:NAD+ kinase
MTTQLLVYARPSIQKKLSGLRALHDAARSRDLNLRWHTSLEPWVRQELENSSPIFFDQDDLETYALQKNPSNSVGESLILVLGGDGTMLDTVPWAVAANLPIFGFHFGRLGFLSSAGGMEDIQRALDAIQKGELVLEERSLLECQYPLNNEGTGTAFALNEVALHRMGASLMRIACHLDGELLNSYQADGLLVATPTGSTAYSMSCGGPIVLPSSKVWTITPVAGHQLGIRPVVVDQNVQITLQAESEISWGPAQLMVDGKVLDWPGSGILRLQSAPKPLRLARFKGFSHLDNLKTKLLWGLDPRG